MFSNFSGDDLIGIIQDGLALCNSGVKILLYSTNSNFRTEHAVLDLLEVLNRIKYCRHGKMEELNGSFAKTI